MPAAIKVLAFAGARDVIGAPEVSVDSASASTAAEVMDVLCARYPALESYRPIVRMAVNGSYADPAEPVGPGDEVALIPPVAGG